MKEIKIIVDNNKEKLDCYYLKENQCITIESAELINYKIERKNYPPILYKGELFGSKDIEKVINLKREIKGCYMMICAANVPFVMNMLFKEIGVEIRNRQNGFCNVCKSDFELKNIAIEFMTKSIDSKKCLRNSTKKAIHFMISDIKSSNLQVIAEQIGISPDYLALGFKKDIGDTYRNFSNRLKVYIAKKLLINNRLKIGIIAEKLGYNDLSNFYRFFKKQTNTTPQQFIRDS